MDILQRVDVILSEDTRNTLKLLNHYGIRTRLLSLYKFNEAARSREVIDLLRSGKDVALVSDAGTPLVADPGYFLVKEVLHEGFRVTALPGPSAVLPALILSGFRPCPFTFLGFLPRKSNQRKKLLEKAGALGWTFVLYESPHRLLATLDDMEEVLGADTSVAVARELTKIHEEVIRGSLEVIKDHFKQHGVKGELVIVVGQEGREKEL